MKMTRLDYPRGLESEEVVQVIKTMTTSTVTDGVDAPEDKEALANKILSMTGEETMLFIYLAEKEHGLRFD